MEMIRPLTLQDRPIVSSMWQQIFGDSDRFIEWFFSERYCPETSLCLEADGQIASVMQGCPMDLRLRGKQVRGMMISGVSTLPEYRKHGWMHRVMREMMQLARQNGCAVVFDKPQNLPTFFSLGHLPCTDTLHFVSDFDVPMPVWSDDFDIPALAACYRDATAEYSGCVLRSDADMALKLRDYRSDGAKLLSLWDSGTITAYCIAFFEEDGIRCEEVLARDPDSYQLILSLLPFGARAKLPPDVSVPGQRRPQNVIGAADIPALLSLLVADDSFVFAVNDPVVPENNGVFDGCGNRASRAPLLSCDAGELMQMLAGYRALPGILPAVPCYCVDEY